MFAGVRRSVAGGRSAVRGARRCAKCAPRNLANAPARIGFWHGPRPIARPLVRVWCAGRAPAQGLVEHPNLTVSLRDAGFDRANRLACNCHESAEGKAVPAGPDSAELAWARRPFASEGRGGDATWVLRASVVKGAQARSRHVRRSFGVVGRSTFPAAHHAAGRWVPAHAAAQWPWRPGTF